VSEVPYASRSQNAIPCCGDGPDAADLGIDPAKLSDPAIRVETAGELFWKITVGKKPMPNYGTRLSPADRWNVINYLRSLAKK
jgi:mono/diheme cytochrome c family protein